MSLKNAITLAVGVAVLFAVCVSGCRGGRRDTAMMNSRDGRTTPVRKQQNVRPAEVLSATASRPPQRQYAAAPVYQQPAPYQQQTVAYQAPASYTVSNAYAVASAAPAPYQTQTYSQYPTQAQYFESAVYSAQPATTYQTVGYAEPVQMAQHSAPVAAPMQYIDLTVPSYRQTTVASPSAYSSVQPMPTSASYQQTTSAMAYPAATQSMPQLVEMPAMQARQPEHFMAMAAPRVVSPAQVQPSTPDLAMARASMPPAIAPLLPFPTEPIPQTMSTGGSALAPLPELEPAKYPRTIVAPATARPVAEIMMTAGHVPHEQDRQEVQRALEPLPVAAPIASQSWVSSPTTAMRTTWR